MEDVKKLNDAIENEVVGGAKDEAVSTGNAVCPRCGSTDVTYYGRDPFTGYNEYRCNTCGNHWNSMD